MKDPILILSEHRIAIIKAEKQFIYRTITTWLTKELHK